MNDNDIVTVIRIDATKQLQIGRTPASTAAAVDTFLADLRYWTIANRIAKLESDWQNHRERNDYIQKDHQQGRTYYHSP